MEFPVWGCRGFLSHGLLKLVPLTPPIKHVRSQLSSDMEGGSSKSLLPDSSSSCSSSAPWPPRLTHGPQTHGASPLGPFGLDLCRQTHTNTYARTHAHMYPHTSPFLCPSDFVLAAVLADLCHPKDNLLYLSHSEPQVDAGSLPVPAGPALPAQCPP